jgi:hypothetical protein
MIITLPTNIIYDIYYPTTTTTIISCTPDFPHHLNILSHYHNFAPQNKMGVKNGSATLHSITDLTLAKVAHMCCRLADNKGISPRVVANCSNLIYIFKSSYTPIAISLVNHFKKLTTAGIIVVPVCDSYVRPTAKQATKV